MKEKISTHLVPIQLDSQQESQILNIPVTHINPSKLSPANILVMGLGEESLTINKIASFAIDQDYSLSIALLPYPNKQAIELVSRNSLKHIAAHVNRYHSRDELAPVNVIGHSQGGGVILLSAVNTEQLSGGRHVLIAPVTLNSPLLGEGLDDRRKEFWRRLIIANSKNDDIINLRYLHYRADVAKRAISDRVFRSAYYGYDLLKAKVNYAVSDETHSLALDGYQHLSITSDAVQIITGASDPLFPSAEIIEVLLMNNIDTSINIQELRGGHETIISRNGLDRLKKALEFVTNN